MSDFNSRSVIPGCRYVQFSENGKVSSVVGRVAQCSHLMLFVISSSIQWPGVSPSTLAPRHSSVFGGHKAVVRPDPIPNSAVKHSLADGSGFIDSARVGCRQFFKKAETKVSVFFLPFVQECVF